MAEFIYIFVHPRMPGLCKIGRTDRDPRERARELSRSTGVPGHFIPVWWVEVADSSTAEREIHCALSYCRVPKREFFEITHQEAISLAGRICRKYRRADQGCLSTVAVMAIGVVATGVAVFALSGGLAILSSFKSSERRSAGMAPPALSSGVSPSVNRLVELQDSHAAPGSHVDGSLRDMEFGVASSSMPTLEDRDANELERLEQLSISASQLPSPRTSQLNSKVAMPPNTRLWVDRTGRFSARAEFGGVANKTVTLHKSDGTTIKVHMDQLSVIDKDWIIANAANQGSAR